MRKHSLLATMLICFFSIPAQAATITTTITQLHIYNNIVYIDIADTVATKPACATNGVWDFAFDPLTPIGAHEYSLVLAAFSAGRTVKIAGSDDTCAPVGTTLMHWISVSQ